MSSKKIIIIGTTASNMYIFRSDLIRQLITKNHKVYVFVSEYTVTQIQRIKDLGADVVTYQLSRGGLNPFADIQSTIDITRKVKKINPDILFAYTSKPIIYGAWAARLAKVPHVVGMLEGLGYTFTDQPDGITIKTKLVRNIQVLLYRLSLPHLDNLIFLNPDDPLDLLEKYAINVKSTANIGGIGLNLKDYPYSEAPISPINFLFIGRLLKEKGIFELIESIRIVKKRHPNVSFTILGGLDPENMGALKEKHLNELLEEGLFEYPGYVTDVDNWIKRSSVFVLPSYREGVPRSTQEAMAIGRPIITTDVPGCRETVVDGLNGFLVEKWNVLALADKMCFFIENPDLIRKMGSESRKIAVQNFDVTIVNRKIFEILGLKE